MNIFINLSYLKILPCILAIGLSNMAFAVERGHGQVSMQGSIVDTACTISMKDQYQIINISVQPVFQIINSAQRGETAFLLHLENCSLQSEGYPRREWRYFQVTFDGASEDGKLFSLQGKARGVGLEILDTRGTAAIPGVPLPPGEIIPGAFELSYRIRLKSNNKRPAAGDYRAIIRFRTDYF